MDAPTIIGSMRTAVSFAERLQNSELLTSLLEAQSGLLGAVSENLELQAAVAELKSQVAELKTALAISDELKLVGGLYYAKSELDDNDMPTGNAQPCCQRCLEVDHVVTHVQWMMREKRFECKECKSSYVEHFR